MPLTSPAWEKNFRLQAATTGGNPLKKGDSGPHIAILRKNLEAVGFERSLEPRNFYGTSTAGMIRDFRLIYEVPGNGELTDKAVLEALDAILNKKIAQRSFKPGVAASAGAKGKDFAVRYLATTREWVDTAIKASRSVEQSLTAAMNAKTEPDFPSSIYQPFMQHFRLLICLKACEEADKNRLSNDLFLAYNNFDDATKSSRIGEVISKVNMVANVLTSLKAYLAGDPDKIFLNSTVDTINVAECDLKKKQITFFQKNFFEATKGATGGMDKKSASWVTIHESTHAVLLNASTHAPGTGPGDNPYSYDEDYYRMTWQHATKNPDAYAHFAYQVVAGKQNFGPWA